MVAFRLDLRDNSSGSDSMKLAISTGFIPLGVFLTWCARRLLTYYVDFWLAWCMWWRFVSEYQSIF